MLSRADTATCYPGQEKQDAVCAQHPDGAVSNEGVVIIAATNHPELIDPAILRSGRLEDRITLRPPNVDALATSKAASQSNS